VVPLGFYRAGEKYSARDVERPTVSYAYRLKERCERLWYRIHECIVHRCLRYSLKEDE
jgi:hypothetical protein